MKPCQLCGELTNCVININFKAVPVCDPCTWGVTKQTVAAHDHEPPITGIHPREDSPFKKEWDRIKDNPVYYAAHKLLLQAFTEGCNHVSELCNKPDLGQWVVNEGYIEMLEKQWDTSLGALVDLYKQRPPV